ncbi:hypothetical protein TNCV_644981 [Trichonephila clavipes]|nr:hypothetical protein TNCV_644981 [Trichonephila clavipes]
MRVYLVLQAILNTYTTENSEEYEITQLTSSEEAGLEVAKFSFREVSCLVHVRSFLSSNKVQSQSCTEFLLRRVHLFKAAMDPLFRFL